MIFIVANIPRSQLTISLKSHHMHIKCYSNKNYITYTKLQVSTYSIDIPLPLILALFHPLSDQSDILNHPLSQLQSKRLYEDITLTQLDRKSVV